MSLAHLTLATRDVEGTTRFFERTLGYRRGQIPANSPVEVQWLEIGNGQQLHVIHVPDFTASAFEEEFGRHIAFFYPGAGFTALKTRFIDAGATITAPLRPTPFNRFFVREPVNGYLLEVIDAEGAARESAHAQTAGPDRV